MVKDFDGSTPFRIWFRELAENWRFAWDFKIKFYYLCIKTNYNIIWQKKLMDLQIRFY